MKRKRKRLPLAKADQYSKGQTFIIIAAAFLVLVGFVGLAIDAGLAFIAYGELARASDAAALAAAAQFREGRDIGEMQATAANAMAINNVGFSSIDVEVCDYSQPVADQDPQLCPQPIRKKLVRITVWADIPTAFLRVLGYEDVSLSATSIAEAASVDVVLVLDISESMAWDAAGGDPLRDPFYCNNTAIFDGSEDGSDFPTFPNGLPGECHPFEEVKNAAGEFIARVLDKDEDEEEDRLAIVTFGNGWSSDVDVGTFVRTSNWTSNSDTALSIVENLQIVEPEPCWYADGTERISYGPCAWYDPVDPINSANFVQTYCNSCAASGDLSGMTTTNIGGGLLLGGGMFGIDTREDALWVVIVLTDGMANATMPDGYPGGITDDITNSATYPIGHCPNDWTMPLCQDEDTTTRHDDSDVANYDADDYARDMADFAGCPPEDGEGVCTGVEGQAAVVFTIGLGDDVLWTGPADTPEVNGLPYGVSLLRYIASVGDGSDDSTDLCADFWEDPLDWEEWCGNYYFSPEGDELSLVFQDIASRVFTRLTR